VERSVFRRFEASSVWRLNTLDGTVELCLAHARPTGTIRRSSTEQRLRDNILRVYAAAPPVPLATPFFKTQPRHVQREENQGNQREDKAVIAH